MTKSQEKRHANRIIIYLLIDPLGRPTITAGSDHCFTLAVRLYVRPHISKANKTKQFSSENCVLYWRDCGSSRVDH